jgi:hypothetical protein
MKKFGNLRLREIVDDDYLNVNQLSNIKGGMIMLGYGCKSDVCSKNWTGHPCSTQGEICAEYVCTSGVAG